MRYSIVVGVLILSACAGTETRPATQPVELKFEAKVGDAGFACGRSYDGIGTTRSQITPNDLRFYISEVALIDHNGEAVPVALNQDGVWQYQDVALIDFEDGSGPCRNGNAVLNTSVKGAAPAGDYRGVRFTLGVPFALNHEDPTVAPSPLNSTAMFWVWQAGHKFFKLDMTSAGLSPAAAAGKKDSAAGFSVHLGSTECASASRTTPPRAPCVNPYRVAVEFDRFDLRHNVVVADIANLFSGVNVDINTPGTPPGCMSGAGDADCPGVMAAFGLPYGGQQAGPQRLFTMR